MKIVVQITVSALGAQGQYPGSLGWIHRVEATNNMAYYGDSVQKALEAAFQAALKGTQPYVLNRPDGGPERPDPTKAA